MPARPFPADTEAMVIPELVVRAVKQSIDSGSNYVAIPLHSYEAWVLSSGKECAEGWSYVQHLCWVFDDKWDDELILFCVKPKGHEGDCGKPGTRLLGPDTVR